MSQSSLLQALAIIEYYEGAVSDTKAKRPDLPEPVRHNMAGGNDDVTRLHRLLKLAHPRFRQALRLGNSGGSGQVSVVNGEPRRAKAAAFAGVLTPPAIEDQKGDIRERLQERYESQGMFANHDRQKAHRTTLFMVPELLRLKRFQFLLKRPPKRMRSRYCNRQIRFWLETLPLLASKVCRRAYPQKVRSH